MGTINPFSSLFAKSPFKALQKHIRVVQQCVEQTTFLLQAVIHGDQERVVEVKERIFALEKAADEIKTVMRANLPTSLFLPVDRRDLLEMLDMQDSMADTAQEIAGLFFSRPMLVPEGMAEPLIAFIQHCVATCGHAALIIEELDELVEMGFSGRESAQVLDLIQELGRMEDETDTMGIALVRHLFLHEQELPPVSVVFWYQAIRWMGEMADYAEKVGGRLRLFLAR